MYATKKPCDAHTGESILNLDISVKCEKNTMYAGVPFLSIRGRSYFLQILDCKFCDTVDIVPCKKSIYI